MSEKPSNPKQDGHQGEPDNRVYRVDVVPKPFDWRDGLYVAYIIFTGIAAVIAWSALIAIRRQTEALIDSQRSWCLVKGVKEPDMNSLWIETIIYIFEVVGSRPVRIIESNLVFRLVDGRKSKQHPNIKEPDLPDTPVYGEPSTLLDIPTMGDVIPPGPGPHAPVQLEGMMLKKEDLEALKTWKKFAVSYGFIKYKEAFVRSKIRETRFCYIYDIPQGLIPPDRVGKSDPNTFRVGGPPEYNGAT